MEVERALIVLFPHSFLTRDAQQKSADYCGSVSFRVESFTTNIISGRTAAMIYELINIPPGAQATQLMAQPIAAGMISPASSLISLILTEIRIIMGIS